MAEASNSDDYRHQPNAAPQRQRCNLQTLASVFNCSCDENELLPFDSQSLSPGDDISNPHLAHYRNFRSFSSFDSDMESDYLDSGSDFGGFLGGDDDNLNFATNLFASCEEYVLDDEDSASNPFLDGLSAVVNHSAFGGSYDDFDSDYIEEIGLGFGSRMEFDRARFSPESVESSVSSGRHSCFDGLRVVRMESDSDTEEVDVDVHVHVHSQVPDAEGSDSVDGSDVPRFWDCLGFDDDEMTIANVELEWEEVDDREGLSSVINRIEELSLSSETSLDVAEEEEEEEEDEDEEEEEEEEETGDGDGVDDEDDEDMRNLDWEILLASNNWTTRHSGLEHGVHGDDDAYDAEYDTLVDQFADHDGALKGSPPASKSFMENLPLAVLTKEELQEKSVACAVCKDDILVEEKVVKLPCCHYYHRDCIIPWMGIRNTCPVCRYELPTDDPDYEQRKAQRSDPDLPENLEN